MARMGIDYGTTNTVVVSCDRGRYPVVPHVAESSVGMLSRDVFPSLIVYDRAQGRCLYGTDAERALFLPDASERYGVIRSLKSQLRHYMEGMRIGHDVVPGGLAVDDLLRGCLQALVQSIKKSGCFAAGAPLEALITWPNNANGAQRYITRRCFKEAGFNVVGTLTEPAAAAIEFADRMAHGNRAEARRMASTVAVFDLGGGTFDVSLVRIEGPSYTVLDTAGIEQLGGDDFDEVLARLFARRLRLDYDGLSSFHQALLLLQSRQLKESISSGTVRSLTLSAEEVGLGSAVCTVAVSTYFKELEPMLAPAIEKLQALVGGHAAHQAGVDAASLTAIYLVGGTTKLPLVPSLIARQFPQVPLIMSDKPFTSTAMGAAIRSAEDIRTQDILARSFGVVRLMNHGAREFFAPIFPAGMNLPAAGQPPVRREIIYSPHHNIGHLRYLECAAVDRTGWPSEGVRWWSDVYFPYDPALPVTAPCDRDSVFERDDLMGTTVRETYTCDEDGVITVTVTRFCDNQSRTFEIFRA
jgi:molecular chaperone DnaK (HSP70)